MLAERTGKAPSVPAVTTKRRKAPSVRPWGVFRSKWELEYSRYLDVLKAAGRISWWAYEPDRLPIGVGAVFTPDFLVGLPDGPPEYREVKGFKREAAMVRLKVAAKQYPEAPFVLVTKRNGQWHHTPITQGAA